MYFLVLGLLLVALKLLGLEPVGEWSWWGVLLPFPLASLWWVISDLSGLTKKRAVEREEARRIQRIRKQLARGGGVHKSMY